MAVAAEALQQCSVSGGGSVAGSVVVAWGRRWQWRQCGGSGGGGGS
jgi:hypothetical protein